MLVVRCKECNKELRSNPKTQVCGCSNMMVLRGESVTACDLSKVVMVNSSEKTANNNVLSNQDLQYQEARRSRKVKKLNFEVK